MRRELPAKPNLEHLKSQAKDLLDAHRRGESEAFARIRAAVPAFANMSDDAIAKAPFALHDAQSAIAREYGVVSWAELRAKVAAAHATITSGEADALLVTLGGQPLPPEVAIALHDAMKHRDAAVAAPTPQTVPVLPVRNSVVFPGGIVPLEICRATSLAAVEAVLASQPAFIAMFAQRAIDIERPTSEDLHPTGCLCLLLHRHVMEPKDGAPRSWIAVSGIRWVKLGAVEQREPYWLARVSDVAVEQGDEHEVATLHRALRDRAHRLAAMLPNIPDTVHAMIDGVTDPSQLADFVMAHLDAPVAAKAAYAEEPQVARRLEQVIAVLDEGLAQAAAQPR